MRKEQSGLPQIDERFRLSKGAEMLLEQARQLGIDITPQITRALTGVEGHRNGGKITRGHFAELVEEINQRRFRVAMQP